jgi:sugar lactone lactonase YvrE
VESPQTTQTTTPPSDRPDLTPEQLAARYDGRFAITTLANWRSQGKGPKFRRLGGRIFYALADVEAWERGNTYQSTSQYRAC